MSLKNRIKEWLGIDKIESREAGIDEGIDILFEVTNKAEKNIEELIEQNKFLNMKLDMLMQGKQ